MKRASVLIGAAITISLAAAAFAIGQQQQDTFPHEEHASLFPLCAGCHEGVPTGDRSRFYPSPQVCAGCHNGTEVRRVTWTGPRPKISNLKFSHADHPDVPEGDLDCSQCHTRAGTNRMAVLRPVPERCLGCHEHAAKSHFVDAVCQQCHMPLAQTAFTAARVDRLPMPPSHQQPDFLEKQHGQLAKSQRQQCVVCHTRERCAACHVDAATRAEVVAMPAAQAQLTLPAAKPARYFLPSSHQEPNWISRHGGAAQTISNCAACHTRESCLTCHSTQTPKPVNALPASASVKASGVVTRRRMPESHQAPFFTERHGSQASAKPQTCMSCHTRTQCEQCHNAAASGKQISLRSSTRDFHPSNFLARHASAAYGRNLECSNCHETTKFCRACHERIGMGSSGRLQAGFHDAQPFWLLNHGKPARQGLESCASCHKQTDCMQCHSQLGSFRVSPHGPGFDPARAQSKNARMCFACHLSDPLTRSTQ